MIRRERYGGKNGVLEDDAADESCGLRLGVVGEDLAQGTNKVGLEGEDETEKGYGVGLENLLHLLFSACTSGVV